MGASFSENDYLKKHKRTHTGETPFTCGQCTKSISPGGDLKRHRRSHTIEKTFPCDQCP